MKDSTQLPFAKAFWNLVVYRRSRELQGRVFQFSRALPRDEERSLKDQMRRASRSVGAQIAEAWGKRDYIKHFTSKLSDAQSENLETQHWLITASDDGYLDQKLGHELFAKSLEVGRMLNAMTERAAEFCPDGNNLREESAEWFVPNPVESPLHLDSELSTEH